MELNGEDLFAIIRNVYYKGQTDPECGRIVDWEAAEEKLVNLDVIASDDIMDTLESATIDEEDQEVSKVTPQVTLITPNDVVDNINEIYDIQVTSVNRVVPDNDGNVQVQYLDSYEDLGGYATKTLQDLQTDLLKAITAFGEGKIFHLHLDVDGDGLIPLWNAKTTTGILGNGEMYDVTICDCYKTTDTWNAHLTFESFRDRYSMETQLVAGVFTTLRKRAFAKDATTVGVITINGAAPDDNGNFVITDTTGNAATATNAKNDEKGNNLVATYATKKDTILVGNGTAENLTVTGTLDALSSRATKVAQNVSSGVVAVPILLGADKVSNINTPVFTNGITAIPSTNTINATTFVGALTGLASTALADADNNVLTEHYAPLANPVLTGIPTAPTATAGTNTNQLATTAFVNAAVSNLVSSAPTTLDTLNELATALGNDPNFATTITTEIGTKLNANDVTTTATANKVLRLNVDGKLEADVIGNAATATKATKDSDGNDINITYMRRDGTTFTGTLTGDTAGAISLLGTGNIEIGATGTGNICIAKDSAGNICTMEGSTGSIFSAGTGSIYTSGGGNIYAGTTGNIYTNGTGKIYTTDATNGTITAAAGFIDETGKNINTRYAPLASAALTGTPTTPTALAGDNSTQIANTSFVHDAIPTVVSAFTNDARYVAADASGNVSITGTLTAGKVYNAYYNDYAEYFERGGETETGDIIALDETDTAVERYIKATKDSKCVVGVQSGEYAQIIGGKPNADGETTQEYLLKKYIPVAVAGRVHVKFRGLATVGMLVVPSEYPGVGRAFEKGDDYAKVIGRIVACDAKTSTRLVKIKVI